MAEFAKVRFGPIAKKIITSVILFSTLMTFIITLVQLYLDYRKDLGLIDSRLRLVENVHTESLTASLWAADLENIQIQLDGILRMPDMEYAVVTEGEKIWGQSGAQISSNIIEKTFPLVYRNVNPSGRDREIGLLRIVATLDGVYGRLIDKGTTVLVSNAIKTFCVVVFMLFIFHHLVTRHLVKIARFTQQHGIDHLNEADLKLNSRSKDDGGDDELDIVVNGINQMRKNIADAYQLVKRSEEKYRQLVETAQEGIWTIDQNGVTTFVNPAMASMLGYRVEELIGKNVFDFVDASDNALAEESLKGHRQGIAAQHDFKLLRKTGERIYTTMATSPLFDKDGRYAGSIAGVIDITRRIQDEMELKQHRSHLEELVRQRTCALEISNKELEAFSYTVAHDLRTPLRSITSFSQLLKMDAYDKLNDEERVMLERIVNAGKKMSALIDDVLQLSRISKTKIQLQQITVSDMAKVIVEQLQQQEPGREVDLRIEPGITITGDPSLVYFLLQNLLQNAWKFSRNKQPAVIEVKLRNLNGVRWVYIIDNGAGYNMAYADKLFKTFERLHLESEFEGTGVGLASVQRIVQMHGGQIRTDSVENQGARFYFTLDSMDERHTPP